MSSDAIEEKNEKSLVRPHVVKFLLTAAGALVLLLAFAFFELQDDFWDIRSKECRRDVDSLQNDVPVYGLLQIFDKNPPKEIKAGSLGTLARLGGLWIVVLIVAFRRERRFYKMELAQSEIDDIMSIFETRSSVPGEGPAKINGFEALNRLGEYLHRYHSLEEIHQVIRKMAVVLFPLKNGAFYTYNESTNTLELAVSWGDFSGARSMMPQDCVGVVGAKMSYIRRGEEVKERCAHLPDREGEYFCVPIMGMGRLFGLFHLQRIDGSEAPVGAVPNWIAVARAFADRVGLYLANLKLQDDFAAQALRDPVTRVFNGKYLEETLTREIFAAKRRNSPVGLILVDLDYFEEIGKLFGRGAAECFLNEVARLITGSIRAEDICCRFREGEFGVLLPTASVQIVLERAEMLRQAVEQLRLAYGDNFLSTTITLSVAVYPDHCRSGEELLAEARAALAKGISRGRNCTVIAGEN